jgi:hypothetical protein
MNRTFSAVFVWHNFVVRYVAFDRSGAPKHRRRSVNEAPACREYLARPKKSTVKEPWERGGSKKKPPHQTDDEEQGRGETGRSQVSRPDNMNGAKKQRARHSKTKR